MSLGSCFGLNIQNQNGGLCESSAVDFLRTVCAVFTETAPLSILTNSVLDSVFYILADSSCSYPFIHLFILIIAVVKDTGYTPVFGTRVSDD